MNTGEVFNEIIHGKQRVVDPHAAEWERTYAMFTHLALVSTHFGVAIIPTLIMWLIKRDKSPFLDDHGREAMNFQLSLLIYALGTLAVGFLTCGVGFVLWVPVYLLGVTGMVLAAIAASKGQFYRYPMTIRML